MRGYRLITATEVKPAGRWHETRVKEVTGGDTISARFMRQDFFEYRPAFKLLISGNHKPSLRSVNEAMRRRLHLLPFTVTIPPRASATPNLFTYAAGGRARRHRRRGRSRKLHRLAAAKACTHEPRCRPRPRAYFSDQDAIGRWVGERCKVGEKRNAVDVQFPEIVRRLEGVEPRHPAKWSAAQKAFSQALEERGFRKPRSRAKRQCDRGSEARRRTANGGRPVEDVKGLPVPPIACARVRTWRGTGRSFASFTRPRPRGSTTPSPTTPGAQLAKAALGEDLAPASGNSGLLGRHGAGVKDDQVLGG